MKICFKDECCNMAIPRGKYCEDHSNSRKKKIDKILKEVIEEEKKSEINNLIEEERKLIADQDEEYKISMIADIDIINKKREELEMNEILEISKKMFIEEKRSKIMEESENDFYNIKIKLHVGNTIKRKFSRCSSFLDIRNYLDIYFHDNNINILNYNLIIYPKIIFSIKNNEDTLEKHNLPKNLNFFINNLDI